MLESPLQPPGQEVPPTCGSGKFLLIFYPADSFSSFIYFGIEKSKFQLFGIETSKFQLFGIKASKFQLGGIEMSAHLLDVVFHTLNLL